MTKNGRLYGGNGPRTRAEPGSLERPACNHMRVRLNQRNVHIFIGDRYLLQRSEGAGNESRGTVCNGKGR